MFRAEWYVLFRVDKSRGSKVLLDVLGKEFEGILSCDYFSAYRKYMKNCNMTVQFYLAHLIRDIRYLTTWPDQDTKDYGERVLKGVRWLFKLFHKQKTQTADVFKLALEVAKAELSAIILETVSSELDAQGKKRKMKVQNLAHRFRNHGDAYFEFITTPNSIYCDWSLYRPEHPKRTWTHRLRTNLDGDCNVCNARTIRFGVYTPGPSCRLA